MGEKRQEIKDRLLVHSKDELAELIITADALGLQQKLQESQLRSEIEQLQLTLIDIQDDHKAEICCSRSSRDEVQRLQEQVARWMHRTEKAEDKLEIIEEWHKEGLYFTDINSCEDCRTELSEILNSDNKD